MQGILFFTFFGYRDYISDIKDSFERNQYTVYDIPYLQFKNDDMLTDQDIIKKITNISNEKKITAMIMYLLPPVANFISDLKKAVPKLKLIFYNFDDPSSFNLDLIRYGKGIDYFFTPCSRTASKLQFIMADDIGRCIHLPYYHKKINLKLQ